MHTDVFDRTGKRLAGNISTVPDGAIVRQSLALMDGAQDVALTDADRAHLTMCQDLCAGGSFSPAAYEAPAVQDGEVATAEARAVTARAMMVADLHAGRIGG